MSSICVRHLGRHGATLSGGRAQTSQRHEVSNALPTTQRQRETHVKAMPGTYIGGMRAVTKCVHILGRPRPRALAPGPGPRPRPFGRPPGFRRRARRRLGQGKRARVRAIGPVAARKIYVHFLRGQDRPAYKCVRPRSPPHWRRLKNRHAYVCVWPRVQGRTS